MVFIIRLRSRAGVTRLLFKTEEATWEELQRQIKDVLGVEPTHQLISREPLHKPKFITVTKKTDSLTSLGLKHGDQLYLGGEARPDEKMEEAKETFQLAPECTHGPKGRCIYCDGARPGEKMTGKCTHGPGATCMHCSKHVADTKSEPATWLCNHPDTAFCIKCAPPVDPEEALGPKKKVCSCNWKKGQRCTLCLDLGPAIKIDIIPFKRFMDERKALCKYKHGASVTCAFCAPPPMPSFKGKTSCNKGHRPWPKGVCLSCAPPVPHLRPQKYRHCDTVSVQGKLMQTFYGNYFRAGKDKQRGALLFGTYMDEPGETKNVGAIRAVVQAIYEPPQDSKSEFRFLRDPHDALLHEVAALMGMEPVGWALATLPRAGEKYGGPVFLSASEIKIAAKYQDKYKNKDSGYSRFVTVVIEHSKTIEPKAYQVSDQCVAMERDGCLVKSKDPYMMACPEAKTGEIVPHIIYQDTQLKPGQEYLPDDFIVKVIVATAETKTPLFKHDEFVSEGGDLHMKQYLTEFSQEPYHEKFSDFNLLVYLAKTFGLPLTRQVCAGLKTNKPFDKDLCSALDRALTEKNLFIF